MFRRVGRMTVMAGWLVVLVGTAAVALVDPSSLVKVPDPRAGNNPFFSLTGQAVPQVGRTFRDGRFKTRLTRVTQGPNWRQEYSRFDPLNGDKSLIVLRRIHSGDWAVFKTRPPYDADSQRVMLLREIEDPRWDPRKNDVLWCLRGFTIIQYNLRTQKVTVVKDFRKDPKLAPIIKAEPDLYRVTMKNEGEPSTDMRYWALGVQGKNDDYRLRYLFCWDRQQNRIVGLTRLAKNESGIDWVGMSPKGTYVLIGADYNNHGRFPGLVMADRKLTRFHRLAYGTAHSDVGLDAAGREVIVMQNTRTDHIDLIPLDWKTRPILESGGSYAGTNLVRLIRLFYSNASPHGFTGGIHVSCNTPGWCVISTYQRPGKKAKNWLSRKIVLVRLDRKNPRAYYLAQVHSDYKKYWEETHATITRDGRTVLWASNWGQNAGQEKVFMMRLDLTAPRAAAPPPKPAAPAPAAPAARPARGCPRAAFTAAVNKAVAAIKAKGRAGPAGLDRIVFCGRGRISVMSLKGTVIWHPTRRLMARNFWDLRAPGAGGYPYRTLSAAASPAGAFVSLKLPGPDGAWADRCAFVRRLQLGRLPVMVIAERPGSCP
jgi:hypothetical protein